MRIVSALTLLLSLSIGQAQEKTVTVGLIGDSTVAEQSGWGPAFAERFDGRATIINYAKNGATLQALSKKLDELVALKPDYVCTPSNPAGPTLRNKTLKKQFPINNKRSLTSAVIPLVNSSQFDNYVTRLGKMKIALHFLSSLLILSPFGALASDFPSLTAGANEIQVEHDGFSRRLIVTAPKNYSPDQPPFSPMYSAQIRSSRPFRQKQIPSSDIHAGYPFF